MAYSVSSCFWKRINYGFIMTVRNLIGCCFPGLCMKLRNQGLTDYGLEISYFGDYCQGTPAASLYWTDDLCSGSETDARKGLSLVC